MIRGAKLTKDQSLKSLNKRFKAFLTQEGSFVVSAGKRTLWSTNTTNSTDVGSQIFMQEDGDLVLLDQNGLKLWSSNTRLLADYLICQDDGSLVLFNSSGFSVWSTGNSLGSI